LCVCQQVEVVVREGEVEGGHVGVVVGFGCDDVVVWVVVGLVTGPRIGVVAGHASVGYKMGKGGVVCIESQRGILFRGNLRATEVAYSGSTTLE